MARLRGERWTACPWCSVFRQRAQVQGVGWPPMSMTSRERVRAALNFQEPDRVPIDLGGCNCTGICVDAYVELVRYLGLDGGLDLGPPKVYEPFEMLARMDEPVRRLLHGDVIGLENPSMKFDLENRDWKPWRTQVGHDVMMPGNFHPQVDDAGNTYILDAHGERTAVMVPGALYFDKVCPVGLSDEFVKMDPEVWRRSIGLYSQEHLRILEDDARQLCNETEYAVLGEFGRGGLGSTSKFAGHTFTDWLCLLVMEPQYCFSILQATAERAIENLELYFQAVGRYIDIVFISAVDFGTQKRLCSIRGSSPSYIYRIIAASMTTSTRRATSRPSSTVAAACSSSSSTSSRPGWTS